MNCYIVRMLPNHDFFVPFEEPLTVSEVKDEMFNQISTPTKNMVIIYNGQILEDHINLSSLGITNASVLFLFVKNFDSFLLHDPKRLLLEISSLASYFGSMQPEVMKKATKEIRGYIDSPMLKALAKVSPEVSRFLSKVLESIDMLNNPFDESMLNLLNRIHDNSFNVMESLNGEIRTCSNNSSNTIELILVDSSIDEIEIEEQKNEFTYQPTNLDYVPCINSNPLPTIDYYDDPNYDPQEFSYGY